MKYIFKKNSHYSTPKDFLKKLLPKGGNFSYRWVVDFTESCWFDQNELQEDAKDWNFKLGGVTTAFQKNNVNAVIGVARPNLAQKDTLELNWYINDDKANWTAGLSPIIVSIGEQAVIEISRNKSDETTIVIYKLSLNDEGKFIESDKISKTSKVVKGPFRLVGPYFGGNRPAPHDMEIWVDLDKL